MHRANLDYPVNTTLIVPFFLAYRCLTAAQEEKSCVVERTAARSTTQKKQ
jgi:hypothetical protein